MCEVPLSVFGFAFASVLAMSSPLRLLQQFAWLCVAMCNWMASLKMEIGVLMYLAHR